MFNANENPVREAHSVTSVRSHAGPCPVQFLLHLGNPFNSSGKQVKGVICCGLNSESMLAKAFGFGIQSNALHPS